MILAPHPDPDYQGPKAAGLKFIGYWTPLDRRPDHPECLKLPDPRLYVDRKWGFTERAYVLRHLRGGVMWEGWMGPSWCRFGCTRDADDVHLGSRDLTDGVYVWPEGFAHYVERHSVRPPQEFIDHVLAYGRTR